MKKRIKTEIFVNRYLKVNRANLTAKAILPSFNQNQVQIIKLNREINEQAQLILLN